MIDKLELEDKILQLIRIAEINIQCCLEISTHLSDEKIKDVKYLNSDTTRFLILTMTNYFFETINILNTLLYPTQEDKEISIILWNKKFNTDKNTEDDIIEIKKEFRTLHFVEIRQNISSHKNIKKAGDPEIYALMTIKRSFLSNLLGIIEKIKKGIFSDRWFELPVCNNYLEDAISGLKEILAQTK